MELIRPIPRIALVKDGELLKPKGVDGWGKTTFAEPVRLKYIRVEAVKSRQFNLSGDLPEISAVLYYDCVNSLPENAVFDTGDTVRINSREYRVKTVKEFYGTSRKIHHLEVELV